MIPKAPRRPAGPLTLQDSDLLRYRGPLWRVHATGGEHPVRWDEARTYGPLANRWDPQPEPVGDHPGHGVLYAAVDPTTALGETFQATRRVDLFEQDRHLTGWLPRRELMLLDLTDTWAVRQGASFSLAGAPRSTCRAWARAIHEEFVAHENAGRPQLDGLCTPSTMTGRAVVTLFDPPAADAFPDAPDLSRPLHHGGLIVVIARALDTLGYELVPPRAQRSG